jgi:hypothetical protein
MVRIDVHGITSGICDCCQRDKKELFLAEFGPFNGPTCLDDIGKWLRMMLKQKKASADTPTLFAKEDH